MEQIRSVKKSSNDAPLSFHEKNSRDKNSGEINPGEADRATVKTHKLSMSGRRKCALTGVKDVLSFDLHEILLETEQGMLLVKGDDLHVSRLTLEKGEVDIDGKLDSFTYSELSGSAGQKASSLLGRLFR